MRTIEDVARLLDLHVKTVRRYVRDGRLKARRIGKQYRITDADLAAFTGGALAPAAPTVARTRHVLASTILDVEVVSPQESQRITTTIIAALNSRRAEADFPSINSIYYPEHAKLRITITAGAQLTAAMLQLVDKLLEDGRGRNL
jgi:excisionase family DNA binding protein